MSRNLWLLVALGCSSDDELKVNPSDGADTGSEHLVCRYHHLPIVHLCMIQAPSRPGIIQIDIIKSLIPIQLLPIEDIFEHQVWRIGRGDLNRDTPGRQAHS